MLFSQRDHHPFDDLQAVVGCEQVIAMQDRVKRVRVDPAVADYIVRLVGCTRGDTRLRLGVSPRGSLTLYRTAQACALLGGGAGASRGAGYEGEVWRAADGADYRGGPGEDGGAEVAVFSDCRRRNFFILDAKRNFSGIFSRQ
jgi:hypothetical protein